MKKVIVFIFTCVLPCICFSENLPLVTWTPQWSFDPMDDSVRCSLFSSKFHFKGKFGSNWMYIGVQDNGVVTFQSEKDTFDSRYVSKIGIRVNENPAIFNPTYVSPSLLRFSPDMSVEIVEQLYVGQYFTIQVVFFPDGKLVNDKLHIGQDFTAFPLALNSKNSCSQIRNGEGWVGIAFADMTEVESYINFVREKSDFESPGVIIWTVHPRKEGAQAGLENFDIVLGVNSAPINMSSLMGILTGMSSGASIEVNILRGNKFRTIKLRKP